MRLSRRLRGTEAAAGPTASWMNYVQYMRMIKVRANYKNIGQIPCKNTDRPSSSPYTPVEE